MSIIASTNDAIMIIHDLDPGSNYVLYVVAVNELDENIYIGNRSEGLNFTTLAHGRLPFCIC